MSKGEEHEIAFMQAFVEKHRQERYLELRVENRKKWLDRLNHMLTNELRSDFIVSEEMAQRMLAEQDVTHAWLFADASDADMAESPLDAALQEINRASFGIVGSFIPGRLACFRPEAPSGSILLYRQ
ncbi:hypothetical protein [Botrimarina sp.]|uniref:hypothetical protein n=1 Tax=Botrimarina sp. TaxID=2795802 RepID=UPI0032EC1A93